MFVVYFNYRWSRKSAFYKKFEYSHHTFNLIQYDVVKKNRLQKREKQALEHKERKKERMWLSL